MKGLLLRIVSDVVEGKQLVEVKAVTLDDDRTLIDMYRLIECTTVDVVRLADDLDMWVDDEGMFTAPVNNPASFVAALHGFNAQRYHGNCLFMGGADERGNTLGLSEEASARLMMFLAAGAPG